MVIHIFSDLLELSLGLASIDQVLLISLPWFRVHIVLLNDPGRLISTHLMHTSLVSGWSGVMALYEIVILDSSDYVYNPLWRQGSYVMPFISRLGVVTSIFNWSLGINTLQSTFWTFEIVSLTHIILAGLLTLSSCWHWAYWCLDLFLLISSGKLSVDIIRALGIHISISSSLCLFLGTLHLTGIRGPGYWTSDSFGIIGSVRLIKPVYSLVGLIPYCYGSMPSHHISSGYLGLIAGLWHISARPTGTLYLLLVMSNIESVLSSSLASVLFTSIVTSSTIWYGTITSPIELLGTSRYQWDNGYFSLDLERRIHSSDSLYVASSWEQIPDKLLLYDYVGSNPSKGVLKGDGIIQHSLKHSL